MKIHYLKDVPEGELLHEGLLVEHTGRYYITERTFLQVGDYTRSQPTSPSPGQIYRKARNWSNPVDPNWFLYICERDPADFKGVIHYGKKVVIVR